MPSSALLDKQTIYTCFTPQTDLVKRSEDSLDHTQSDTEKEFVERCERLGIKYELQEHGRVAVQPASLAQRAVHQALNGPSVRMHLNIPENRGIKIYKTSIRDYLKVVADKFLFKDSGKSPKEINEYVDNAITNYEQKIETLREAYTQNIINENLELDNTLISRKEAENFTKSMSPKSLIEQGLSIQISPEDLVLSNMLLRTWQLNNTRDYTHLNNDLQTNEFVKSLDNHNRKTLMDARENTCFANTKHRLPEQEYDRFKSSR